MSIYNRHFFSLYILNLRTFVLTILVLIAPSKALSQAEKSITESIHGRVLEDPYRWMEQSPEKLKDWLENENHTFSDYANKNKEFSFFRKEIEKSVTAASIFSNLQPTQKGLYYLAQISGSEISSLKLSQPNSWEKSIDINLINDGKKDKSGSRILYYHASPSGRLIVYGLTFGGDENSTMKIFDVDAKTEGSETLELSTYPYVRFLPDESGFFYVKSKSGSNADQADTYAIMLHIIGKKYTEDEVIFSGKEETRSSNFSLDGLTVEALPKAKVYLATATQGVSGTYRIYYKRFDQLAPKYNWTLIASEKEGIIGYSANSSSLFLHMNAENGKSHIESVDFAKGKINRKLVRGYKDDSIDQISASEDAIYLISRKNLRTRLVRIPFTQKKEEDYSYPIGEELYAIFSPLYGKGIFIQRRSYKFPDRFFQFDITSRKEKLISAMTSSEPVANLEVIEARAQSYDKTEIPYFIIKSMSTALSKETPAILNSYAAYGTVTTSSYNRNAKAWYESGGIRIECMARGGGDLGEAWHEAGKRAKKKNSVLDTIACAEDLVKKGYTSPKKLGFIGSSAGGIIVGALVTQRPDLFAAVVGNVAAVHLARLKYTRYGPDNISEFGDIDDPVEGPIILDLDGYYSIKRGNSYPSVLMTHGYNDARVPVWMPAKFAARLKENKADKRPIFMRTYFNNGHGFDASVSEKIQLWTDIYSFFSKELQSTGSN